VMRQFCLDDIVYPQCGIEIITVMHLQQA